ncbi:MAG TPA: TRAP transporter substrate-binding protein [bacterium]|nr:TRAP transporter substrate-binding protein [bacterium]
MAEKKSSGFAAGIMVGALIATIVFSVWVRFQNLDEPHDKKDRVLVLKLAHTLDPSHPVHAALVYMKERLEEISGGAVTIDIYPSGVIGSETECIELLQNGALDLTKTSASPMEGFIPAMAVFSLPYVFKDREHYWRVLDSELGKELLLGGVDKNLRGLCYFDSGSRNFYTKDRPVLTPDDLAGLKIRVMNSKTAISMVSALGGAPTPIAWGELYTALQQGVVDGAENNPPSYYSNRHYEVCKYFSMDGHTRVPDILLISEEVWQGLDPKVKAWLQQAADDASRYQRKLWQEKTEEALKLAQEEGAKIYYPDQRPFVEKVKPLLDSYQGTAVGELLERIREME